ALARAAHRAERAAALRAVPRRVAVRLAARRARPHARSLGRGGPGWGKVSERRSMFRVVVRLSARERAQLADKSFAYVDPTGRRRLPIHDAAHVRAALARFS